MDWFDQQNFPLEFFQSKSTKIFAFQCAFCLEKFEIGLNLEKRLLGHYFTKHYIKDDPAFEFCGIKVEAIELEATDLLKVPNDDKSEDDVKDEVDGNCMDFDDYDNSNNSEEEAECQNKETLECTNKQVVEWSNKETIECQNEEPAQCLVKVEDKFEELLICDYCEKEFSSKTKLQYHILNLHIPMPCTICNKVFKHRISVLKHIRGHKNRTKCNYCERTFSTKQAQQLHIKTLHSKEREKFGCRFCDETFLIARQKTDHEWRHKFTKEGNTFKCFECNNLKSYSPKQARVHFEMIHGEGLVCFICGKKLKNRGDFNFHKKTHLDTIIRYECDYCHKSFKFKCSIQSHIEFYISNKYCKAFKCRKRNNPKNKTIWPCHYCSVGMPTYKEFKKHIDNTHGDDRLYYCRPCKRSYKASTSRKKHNKIVHGIDEVTIPLNHAESLSSKFNVPKAFYCYPCGTFYSKTDHRRLHNKRKHGISQKYIPLNDERTPGNEKSFNKFLHCWTCLRIFATPWNRKGHNRIVHKIDLDHIQLNDERPPEDQYNRRKGRGNFDCKFCKKTYCWLSARTKHNTTVHNIKKSYIPLNDQEEPVKNE